MFTTDADGMNEFIDVVDVAIARQLEREVSQSNIAWMRQVERAEKAEAELAGLRADAERYRWLRSEEVCTEPRYYEFWNRFLEAKLVREKVMDNLIDSAREHKVK